MHDLIAGFRKAFSIDYRTLALFRVVLGILLLVDIWQRSQYVDVFLSDNGVLPRESVLAWFKDATYSLYFINGSPIFSGLLLLLSAFAALALIAGYRTQLATLLSWLLLMSLHHRTSVLSLGADDLMRLLLFWGIFLPLGARYSIDVALERKQRYPDVSHFSFATFAISMQVLYVYWVGALLKTGKAWTQDYSAVYYCFEC